MIVCYVKHCLSFFIIVITTFLNLHKNKKKWLPGHIFCLTCPLTVQHERTTRLKGNKSAFEVLAAENMCLVFKK